MNTNLFKSPAEAEPATKTPEKVQKKETSSILIPTPNEMVALLSRSVVGQLEAKKCISVAVYQHFINCARSDLFGGRVESENHVLLIGPTGSGKSLLLRCLGYLLKIPIFYIPCTNITPDGYRGKNFVNHIDSIAETIVEGNKTKPAIVVWDEVDKLALQGTSGAVESANVYRQMTQTEFLTYLDGARCGSESELDASQILNIAMGAFVGLDAIRTPKTKSEVGFHQTIEEPIKSVQPVTAEHLVQYGLIPEFVGRFARIATLDSLDHTTLRRILTEADGNVLARRKDFFATHGVRLEITDDALDELVSQSLTLGTGARALRVVVDQMLRGVELKLPELAARGTLGLIYDRDAVIGLTDPIEHKGKPQMVQNLVEIRRHAAYAKPHIAVSDLDGINIF